MPKHRYACLAVMLPLASLAPQPARAHAILVDSTPALRGTLPAGPADFTLHYNSRVDRGRSLVTLSAAGGPPQRLTIGGGGPADVMTAHATLAPGEYTLRWQVLAVDGHITRGDVPFTVKP